MKSALKLQLPEARRMAAAALDKAQALGVPETVCITDEGGFPLVLERMDGARVTGPQIAWNKAFTAAGHKRSTHLFNTPPNGPACPATRPSASSGASTASSPSSSAASPSWSMARWWAAWA